MRERTGTISRRPDGQWCVRVTYTDPATKRRKDVRRLYPSHREAKAALDRRLAELDGVGAITNDRMSFSELADHYEAHYLHAAEFVDDVKVSGLRSAYTVRQHLNVLREAFGYKPLRAISYGDLKTFKLKRLKTPTQHGKQRSVASVNRELSLLSRLFHIALREGWIIRNPFTTGEPLICLADEKPRERILTTEEEERLLAACNHPMRMHLRALLVCLLDTGMRRGEMLKLRWRDVDFAAGLITVQAFNTKTLRRRQVAMTSRMRFELHLLWKHSEQDLNSLVLGITSNVKRSFDTAKRIAGIPDLRLHDVRHTAATRLVAGGMGIAEVGRILGHTQPRTTYRYVNAHQETITRAAEIMERLRSVPAERQSS